MAKIRAASIMFTSWIELQAFQQVARYEQRNGIQGPGGGRSRCLVNSGVLGQIKKNRNLQTDRKLRIF